MNIDKIEHDLTALEQKYSQLTLKVQELSRLSSGPSTDATVDNASSGDVEEDAELLALRTKNNKLKYRIGILERSISEARLKHKTHLMESDEHTHKKLCTGSSPPVTPARSASGNHKPHEWNRPNQVTMTNLLDELKELFMKAIQIAYPQITLPEISLAASNFADYQCNSSMAICKLLNELEQKNQPSTANGDAPAAVLPQAGKVGKQAKSKTTGPGKHNPRDVANEIVNAIPPNDILGEASVAGPGFINIKFNRTTIATRILKAVSEGIRIGHSLPYKRVIVDYSSPNIAKEMHVGHLRSTIIGDAIANLFEYLDCNVLRLNHVGDWGTQFGMLLAHLVEKFPDYAKSPPPIGDLQAFYKESKVRFDSDEEFKRRAYSYVVKLQSHDPATIEGWKLICDVSRKEFQQIYDMLGIVGLVERGESFYQDLMNTVVTELEEKKLIEVDEGRKVAWPKNPKLVIPLTVVKSDGGYTYDTSDLAAIKQRVNDEKANRIIYLTDAGQSVHFGTVFDVARQVGYLPADVQVDHVGFGVVLGEDKKKFKTRSGDTVRLKDLLTEGLERAAAKLKEKGRDQILNAEEMKAAQEAVAFGCIKYSDLSHDRDREYVFSFDRMLDDKGNTAVYLLYALTRIRSIIRNANLGISGRELARSLESFALEDPREDKLGLFILRFPEIILEVAKNLYPHLLCGYLYDLSVVFNEFYDKCYCIQKSINQATGETTVKVNKNRILLCEATATVMDTGLRLLGIKTVSKM